MLWGFVFELYNWELELEVTAHPDWLGTGLKLGVRVGVRRGSTSLFLLGELSFSHDYSGRGMSQSLAAQ